MPEVCPPRRVAEMLLVLMVKFQARQTTHGDYEDIEYCTFEADDKARTMAWKVGSGSIAVVSAQGVVTSRITEVDNEGETLYPGQKVIVMSMNFKLVRI